MIDRVAPTARPAGRVAQRQSWRELLFLHWRVPVSVLRPMVPSELEIDTFEGEAWVGLVPFTMLGVRPLWAPPVPGVSDFHETNVRTYVHRDGRDPAVWFFSLDAASRIAVWVARTFWGLPYHHAVMSLERLPGEVVRYSTRRTGGALRATCDVTYQVTGPVEPAQVGTLEHFLAERYVLFANIRDELRVGRVHHVAYPLQRARLLDWDESMLMANGIPRPAESPLAHYASGVDVEVFALERG